MDVRMPGISGLECMKRMRETDPELKFPLVTGLLQYKMFGLVNRFCNSFDPIRFNSTEKLWKNGRSREQ